MIKNGKCFEKMRKKYVFYSKIEVTPYFDPIFTPFLLFFD